MLDAPRLRVDAEMTPPDDEEETAEERLNRELDYCDRELTRRYEE